MTFTIVTSLFIWPKKRYNARRFFVQRLTMQNPEHSFNEAFTRTVDIGNSISDQDTDADLWDIADGMLAGALQFWLYSRQPCGDPNCEDCTPLSTAAGRMAELRKLVEQFTAESDYFHTPQDQNVGRA